MSDNVLYVVASVVHDLERIVKKFANVAVYSYFAEFPAVHKEFINYVSKYGRNEFDRVCFITEQAGDKLNWINDKDVPDPFFRFILDVLTSCLKQDGHVDVVARTSLQTFEVSATMQYRHGDWCKVATTDFAATYNFDDDLVVTHRTSPAPPLSNFLVNKTVWKADDTIDNQTGMMTVELSDPNVCNDDINAANTFETIALDVEHEDPTVTDNVGNANTYETIALDVEQIFDNESDKLTKQRYKNNRRRRRHSRRQIDIGPSSELQLELS